MDTDGSGTRDQPDAEAIIEQDFPNKKPKVHRGDTSRSKYGGHSGKFPEKILIKDSLLGVHMETEESRGATGAGGHC